MDNILNEKKFYNAKRTKLTLPISLDSGKRLKLEERKFQNVSLSELYETERANSTKYSVYGKISPILNFKTITDIKPKPNNETFSFRNKSNWNLLLLRPSSTEKTSLDYPNGNKIDFTKGLPLIPIEPVEIDGVKRVGFRAIFKHDFQVGDFIRITDETNYVGNKDFAIVSVYDDIFFINKTYSESTTATTKMPSLSSFKLAQGIDMSLLQKVNVIEVTSGINKISLLKEADTIDLSNIKYQIFAKKLDAGTERKYYIKTLRVMDMTDDFDVLAFSKTPFGDDIFEFTFNNQLNADYTDNMNYPIDRLYLGIIKLAKTPNITISSVNSKFSTQKYTVNQTDILENISYSSSYSDNAYVVGINDTILYGLVSYNFDQLTEELINPIEHFFIANPNGLEIKFSYNPFTEIKIRQKSDYIESSQELLGSPTYAYYDKNKELYCWRDLYTPGTIDLSGNGIDLPFLNGAHYAYVDIMFNLKNYNTPKYTTGYNGTEVDFTINGNSIREYLSDGLDDSTLSSNNTSLKPNNNAC